MLATVLGNEVNVPEVFCRPPPPAIPRWKLLIQVCCAVSVAAWLRAVT